MRNASIAALLAGSVLSPVHAQEAEGEVQRAESIAELLDSVTDRESCGFRPGLAVISPQMRTCAGAFWPAVEVLLEADPEADARRAAASGDHRLVAVFGHWTGQSTPGVTCLIEPGENQLRSMIDQRGQLQPMNRVELHALAMDYIVRFNRSLIAQPGGDYAGVCRARTAEEAEEWAPVMPLEEWLSNPPQTDDAPDLHAAVRMGDILRVETLARREADIDALDGWGMSPLAWASMRGDPALVAALLQAGADADGSEEAAQTPLRLALNAGAHDTVRLLLRGGADPDRRSIGFGAGDGSDNRAYQMHGRPLAIAVALGDQAAIDQLLDAGAPINSAELNGMGVLAVALDTGQFDLMRFLLARGADWTRLDPGGHNLIDRAVARRSGEGARLLIQGGAASLAASDFEAEIWRLAAQTSSDAFLLALLPRSADFNLAQTSDRMRLRRVVRESDLAGLEAVLERLEGRSLALEEAIASGDPSRLGAIYADGAEMAAGGKRNGLMMAIESGDPEMVSWFIDQGAALDRVLRYDRLALERTDSLSYSARRGDAPPTFMASPYGGGVLQGLPLSVALQKGPPESVRRLLEAGAPVPGRSRPGGFSGALHDAFFGYRWHGDPEMIDLALEIGGAPAGTGPEADVFLREICFWTRDDALPLLERFLAEGYRPRQPGGDVVPNPGLPADALRECMNRDPAYALLLMDYGAAAPAYPPIMGLLERRETSEAEVMLFARLLQAGMSPNAGDGPSSLLERAERYLVSLEGEDAARMAQIRDLLLAHGARRRPVVPEDEPRIPFFIEQLPLGD